MTSMSASSASGGRTMTDLAVSRLTMARSAGSTGLPVRQTMRVWPVAPTCASISSSISTLSRSASTTIELRRWLAEATTSSETIVKIWADQPRITVWPFSTTMLRPLRSSSRRPWMPVTRMPMRMLVTRMPNRVTPSSESRKPGLTDPPRKFATVPGSSVVRKARQTTSSRLKPDSVAQPMSVMTNATMTTTSNVAPNRPATSTPEPRDMNRSSR